MSATPWPPSFDELLRSYLHIADGEKITADLRLADHGLDSMATVSLLLDLESTYGVMLPDEQLHLVVSADVAQLWALFSGAGARGSDEAANESTVDEVAIGTPS
jgi:acyl carrier protein